ncbi:MAG: hypothetical protein Q7V57_01965 [Actinomycetota bacterium]|nr:hypothetical protein [Actinomycetota bacterium]
MPDAPSPPPVLSAHGGGDDPEDVIQPSSHEAATADEATLPFVLGGAWRRPPSRAAILSWAVIIVGFALPLPGLFRGAGNVQDESMMLVFPGRLLKGDLPNEDFLSLYGPGAIHVLAGWYQLVGSSLTAERFVGALQLWAVVTAGHALLRPFGRVAAVTAATTLMLLMLTSTGLAAIAWPGAIGMSLWSLVFGIRALHLTGTAHTRALVVAGLLVGVALSYRPDLVVALGLAWMLLWRLHKWNWRPAVAMLVGLTSMWVHLILVGLPAAWRGIVTEPIFALRPGRNLPRPPSWHWVDGALQSLGEHPYPSSWWQLPALSAPQQMFFWFWLVLIVDLGVPLVVWWWIRRRGMSPSLVVLAAGALFGLGLVGQALQRPDSTHLAWGGAVSFALLPGLIAYTLQHRRSRGDASVARRPRLVAAAPALAMAGILLVVCPYSTYRSYLVDARITVGSLSAGFPVQRGDRHFNLTNQEQRTAAQGAVDRLDALAQPGDRLVVAPVDMRRTVFGEVFFYYLFPDLTPGTYFIEMDPGIANSDDSSLADDVRSADWLILSNFWTGWYEPNDSAEYGSSRPNQVVADDFCLVGNYEDALILLYRRCGQGDGIDPVTIGRGPEEIARMEATRRARS